MIEFLGVVLRAVVYALADIAIWEWLKKRHAGRRAA